MSDNLKPKRKLSAKQKAAFGAFRAAKKNANGAESFTYVGKKYVKDNGRYVKEENVGKKKSRKKSGRKKSPAKKKKSKPPCKDFKTRTKGEDGRPGRCSPSRKTPCKKEGQVRRHVSNGAKAGKWVCSPKKKRKRSKSPRKRSKSPRKKKAQSYYEKRSDRKLSKRDKEMAKRLADMGIAGGRKRSRRRSRRR